MDIAFFIFLVFLFSGIVHLLLFYYLFADVFRWKGKTDIDEINKWPSLTILICARNEAHNLSNTIPIVCVQDYPHLQVVIVNHKSTDKSADILTALANQFENIQVVNCDQMDDALPGKRTALAAGLTVATGEYILLTDADCRPSSPRWARAMVASAMHNSADVVVGVSPYEKHAGLLNAYIQYETAQTAMMYLSATHQGRPYMAVGRNLLIKKDLLQSRLKQSVIPAIKSGDDDLLIANLSYSSKIDAEFKEISQTISFPSKKWSSYFRQKMRHISTAAYYRGYIRWLLQLFHGVQLIFIVCFIFLIFTSSWHLALLVAGARYILMGINMMRNAKRINMSFSIWLLPLFEVLSIIIPSVSWILSSLRSKNNW